MCRARNYGRDGRDGEIVDGGNNEEQNSEGENNERERAGDRFFKVIL